MGSDERGERANKSILVAWGNGRKGRGGGSRNRKGDCMVEGRNRRGRRGSGKEKGACRKGEREEGIW